MKTSEEDRANIRCWFGNALMNSALDDLDALEASLKVTENARAHWQEQALSLEARLKWAEGMLEHPKAASGEDKRIAALEAENSQLRPYLDECWRHVKKIGVLQAQITLLRDDLTELDTLRTQVEAMRSALERIAAGPLNIVHTVYPRCFCDQCKSPMELAKSVLASLPEAAQGEGEK